MSSIYDIFSQQRRVGAQLFGGEETVAPTDIEQPTVVPYSSKAPLGKSVDDALRDMKLRNTMNTKLGDVGGGGTQMPPVQPESEVDNGTTYTTVEDVLNGTNKPGGTVRLDKTTNKFVPLETTVSKVESATPVAGKDSIKFASPELQTKAANTFKKLDSVKRAGIITILDKKLENLDATNEYIYNTKLAEAMAEYGVPGMEDKPTSGVITSKTEKTVNGQEFLPEDEFKKSPSVQALIDDWDKSNKGTIPYPSYAIEKWKTDPTKYVMYGNVGGFLPTPEVKADIKEWLNYIARQNQRANPTNKTVGILPVFTNYDAVVERKAEIDKANAYNASIDTSKGNYTSDDLGFQLEKDKLKDLVVQYYASDQKKGISWEQWKSIKPGDNIVTADGTDIEIPIRNYAGGIKGEKMKVPDPIEPKIVDVSGEASVVLESKTEKPWNNGIGDPVDKGKLIFQKYDDNGQPEQFLVAENGETRGFVSKALANVPVRSVGQNALTNLIEMYGTNLRINGVQPKDGGEAMDEAYKINLGTVMTGQPWATDEEEIFIAQKIYGDAVESHSIITGENKNYGTYANDIIKSNIKSKVNIQSDAAYDKLIKQYKKVYDMTQAKRKQWLEDNKKDKKNSWLVRGIRAIDDMAWLPVQIMVDDKLQTNYVPFSNFQDFNNKVERVVTKYGVTKAYMSQGKKEDLGLWYEEVGSKATQLGYFNGYNYKNSEIKGDFKMLQAKPISNALKGAMVVGSKTSGTKREIGR